MSDYKITYLPEEMISHILDDNVLTILSQRWPFTKKRYESLKEKENEENINFVTMGINSATQLRNYLSLILFDDYYNDYYYNNISNQNYFNDSISNVVLKFHDVKKFSENFDEYANRLNENELVFKRKRKPIDVLKCMFYIEEIKCLLTQFPQKIDRNSIQEFCNMEMSHYEKISLIRNELDRYREKPEKEQIWKKFVLS
ncbi:uncharacterized protein LOC114937424 [Nylanderia fulva]|uniref:uncharacterized protein LOC114937424 n=1 Tax=Nylanderia fulva TaxID=613905 RepID=UPI0010FAE637|nr:uncharacterized protein LOC114937424 [Nylanderia fulva]